MSRTFTPSDTDAGASTRRALGGARRRKAGGAETRPRFRVPAALTAAAAADDDLLPAAAAGPADRVLPLTPAAQATVARLVRAMAWVMPLEEARSRAPAPPGPVWLAPVWPAPVPPAPSPPTRGHRPVLVGGGAR